MNSPAADSCISVQKREPTRPSLWSVILHGRLLSVLFPSEDTSNTPVFTVPTENGAELKPSTEVQVDNLWYLNCAEVKGQQEIHTVRRRFWILLIYCISCALNNLQAVKYCSATDLLACYYGVSNEAINWTMAIFLAIYIVLAFPAMWFLHRYGLRRTILLGSFLNTLSTTVQCNFSRSGDFIMVMVCQALAAIAMPLFVPIPSSLANMWFKSVEVCRASGIATIGFQMGGGLAFTVTPLFLQYTCSQKELIRQGLSNEAYTLAGCNLFIFVLLMLTFEDKPPFPPNLAQAVKKHETQYIKSIKRLLKNTDFNLVLVVYGFNVGVFYAINAFVSEMLVSIYPTSRSHIGWATQLAYVVGALGMVTCGYILDRTHKFKEMSASIAWLNAASTFTFTGLMFAQIDWLSYLAVVLIGLFSLCYASVGFELACEIVYPESEGSSSALLSASSMALGLIFTNSGSSLLKNYGTFSCNLLFCASLLFSSIISVFIKCDCKRTKHNMNVKDCVKPKHSANPPLKLETPAILMKDIKIF